MEESGTRRLKTKEDGAMGSQILQNSSDPDATYREKEGKQNRGYTANIVETVESMEKTEEPTVLITDGAYSVRDNTNAAAEKNIDLVTTDLTGREAKDIAADFEFTEDGKKVIHCSAGNPPKSCNYINQTGQCRISFPKNKCENCPHRDQCNPKMFKGPVWFFCLKNPLTEQRHKGK